MAYDIYVKRDPRYTALAGSGATLSAADHDEDEDRVDPPPPDDPSAEREDEELITSGKSAGYQPTGNPRFDTFMQSWRAAILSFLVANAFLVFTVG